MMRVSKKLRMLSAFFVLSVSTIANANHVESLYFSVESGWSSMANGHVSPYRFKYKKHFGYRAAMGYLFPLPYNFSLGPEISYGYYGQESYQNLTGLVVYYESTGWSLLANLQHPVTNAVNLKFKAGLTAMYQQYDIAGPNVTQGGFYERKISPTIIFAASYNMTPHTDLSISYTHIFAAKAPLTGDPQFTFTNVNRIASIDAVMLGVAYTV